jgi:hypothetical protein
MIGPATFVGRHVRIKDSLAWGNALVDLSTGLENKVSDAFVLCSLQRPVSPVKAGEFLNRIAELFDRWLFDGPIEPTPELVKR